MNINTEHKKNITFLAHPPLQLEILFLLLGHPAGIAQLVEHDLAKVGVEGPSPFSRSKNEKDTLTVSFLFYTEIDSGTRPQGVEGAA